MHTRWRTILLCLCLMSTATAVAQKTEEAKADELFTSGKRLDALPLYESLAKTHPDEMVYFERLATCFESAAFQASDPARIKELRQSERDAAKRAVELGDKANYVLLMANIDPDASIEMVPESPAGALLQEAEKAYQRGDFKLAMEKYTAAAEADPKVYEAPLYAGDTAFVQKDLKAAALWFARAIEVDPNRETAYRYWGDAVMRIANDPNAAKEKFVDAIVAEPYNKFAWQGLQQWATATKAVLMAPKIDLPSAPVFDDQNPKNITININPTDALDKKNKGSFAWMIYSMHRAMYRGDEFKKQFPDEKEYRHSLKEESDSLGLVVSVIQEQKIKRKDLDESLRNLLDLSDAGMLDCWILINGSDNGIARDYAAYREGHRKLLHDYMERFVIHGGLYIPK